MNAKLENQLKEFFKENNLMIENMNISTNKLKIIYISPNIDGKLILHLKRRKNGKSYYLDIVQTLLNIEVTNKTDTYKEREYKHFSYFLKRFETWFTQESVEKLRFKIKQATFDYNYKLIKFLPKNERLGKAKNIEISNLELPLRPYYVLTIEGIKTVKDLVELTKQEIFSFAQLGDKSINQIYNAVEEIGLNFKEE